MNEEEIIKKANELLTRVMSGYGLAKVDKIHLVLQGLLDINQKEKEKNKNLIAQLKDYEKELLEITQKYRELSFKYQSRKDRTSQQINKLKEKLEKRKEI